LPGWTGLYSGAVKSVFFDGEYSQTGGYISATGGLNAINVWPLSGRTDGVDFISFNFFGGAYASSVTEALNGFSSATPGGSVDLRVDFGSNSVWAHPTYFASASPVPEPSPVLLLISGLLLFSLVKRKQLIGRITNGQCFKSNFIA